MVNRSQSRIREQILDLDPYDFEELVADVWEQKGYQTEVTKGSKDEAIDVKATKDTPFDDEEQKILIQVKRYSKNNKIGSEDIRKYATLYQQEPKVNKVMIVTSGEFTNPAEKLGEKLDVATVNGSEVAEAIYDCSNLILRQYLNNHSNINRSSDNTIDDDVITHDLSKTAEGDDISSRAGSVDENDSSVNDLTATARGDDISSRANTFGISDIIVLIFLLLTMLTIFWLI